MTADALDLARCAVACPGWRWVPGMLDTDGWRILRGEDEDAGASLSNAAGEMMHDRSLSLSVLPDLTDPATLGCLLALVREAWGDETMMVQALTDVETPTILQWGVWYGFANVNDVGNTPRAIGPTEAAALVAALEAAP